jgi:hypothetical protein
MEKKLKINRFRNFDVDHFKSSGVFGKLEFYAMPWFLLKFHGFIKPGNSATCPSTCPRSPGHLEFSVLLDILCSYKNAALQ